MNINILKLVDISTSLWYTIKVVISTLLLRSIIQMLDRFERFSFAIAEISRCWRKLASDELAKYGLKSPHATYLTTMYKYPDGITVPKLCEVSGKDKSDASRMIAILEKKGLAQKKWLTEVFTADFGFLPTRESTPRSRLA